MLVSYLSFNGRIAKISCSTQHALCKLSCNFPFFALLDYKSLERFQFSGLFCCLSCVETIGRKQLWITVQVHVHSSWFLFTAFLSSFCYIARLFYTVGKKTLDIPYLPICGWLLNVNIAHNCKNWRCWRASPSFQTGQRLNFSTQPQNQNPRVANSRWRPDCLCLETSH